MSLEAGPTLLHSLLWQRLGKPGLERCELLRDAKGWLLKGTILVLEPSSQSLAAEGAEARYEIRADGAWQTTSAWVSLRSGRGSRTIDLTAAGGSWSQDGTEHELVRGCVDIDLGWSPSTNTLPIRRLDLARGERRDLVAAWVRFPELTLEPLPQTYERLAERRYRYTSAGGAFTAMLEVDEHGLVVDYENGWRRLPGAHV